MPRKEPAPPVRYQLRYQIAPDQDVPGLSAALAEFCTQHHVEEAVLFFGAEEWNTGLLTSEDMDRWFDAIKEVSDTLKQAGVGVSLNPWMTVLHTDRGRRVADEHGFERIESPAGERSEVCASFADPEWQRYIAELYGRFSELGFRVVWVEDDYRFHNHAPLQWGGGFEPAVRTRFEAKVGAEVTREEIVAAILQPGEPHPWRALWMETWREVHLEVAKLIAETVAARSPNEPIVGLMTSHPSSHSVEGRRWDSLFDAFTINGGFAHRPHFAYYSESTWKGRAHPIMMLGLQKRYWRDHIEVAPEIENFSFTAWNKSDTQTWCEMALAQFHGADAMFLDLFPFTGTPATEEPGIEKLLDDSRAGLEWIRRRFTKGMEMRGVELPWREDAAERVRTDSGNSMRELEVDPFGAGSLLLTYGVPVSFSKQPVRALFGRMAWVLDDDQIARLLAGGLLIDGVAADILTQRGYGADLGAKFLGWMERESSLYAIQHVTSEESGAPVGRTLNDNLAPRMAKIEPMDDAVEWTSLCDPWLNRIGAAIVAFENEHGGRVVTFAAPEPQTLPQTYERQRIVQQAVLFCGGSAGATVRVTGTPHLMPMDFTGDSGRKIVVLNGATDPGRVEVRMVNVPVSDPVVTILRPLGTPFTTTAKARDEDGETVFAVKANVPSQGFVIFEW